MAKSVKIKASDEAWESKELGDDEAHAKVAKGNIEAEIDAALELQLISIRLQKSLIEDMKSIATLNGIGYQPLMRQVLKRFVDSEKRQILRDRAYEARAAAEVAKVAPVAKKRKVA